jgi:hypothetical protein
MAFLGNDPGGAGGGQFGDLQWAQLSPNADPSFNNLYGQARDSIPTSMNSLEGLIQGGVNSPLLQSILGPAIQRLMGTEQASRDAVTDAFRSSGGLRSSQYGNTFANNESNIMDKRSSLISDMMSKTLGTLVSGQLQEQQNSFLPAAHFNDLLKTIRPDTVSGVQRPVQPGGSGGGISDPFGILKPDGFGSVDSMDTNNPLSPWYRSKAGASGSQISTPAAAAPTPAAAPKPTPWGGYGLDSVGGGGSTIQYGPWTPSTYNGPTSGYTNTNTNFSQNGNYDASGSSFANFPAPNPWGQPDFY